MSVSFCYEIKKPATRQTFNVGTSSDIEALVQTFGNEVSTRDLPTLRAMHRAGGQKKSLWSEIAEVIERIDGERHDADTTLRVWTEW